MKLRQLDFLIAVVRHGSLNKAANALGVSQPALSKAIDTMEKEFGTRLFKRSNRGMAATIAGLQLARNGEGVINDATRIQAEIGMRKRRPAAEAVKVGCGPSEASRLLPAAISSLQQQDPAVRITVLYGLNEDLMPMVKRGDIDFALSSVPRNASDPNLKHRVLAYDRAAVVCGTGHPLAAQKHVTPAMLLNYPWVLARQRELERRALDDMFLADGLKPPPATVETTSANLMKSLLMDNHYLSFLPREMIYWEQQAGQLTPVAVGAETWERQVGITQRRRQPTRRSARQLIAHIVQRAGNIS